MGKRRIEDVTLPNGSVILWKLRFVDEEGHERVPIVCGSCGKVRTVSAGRAYRKEFSGLCIRCARGYVNIPEAELRRLYEEEGLSMERIAQIYGCSLGTVANRMLEHGIKSRSLADAAIISRGYENERHDFDGDEREMCKLMGFVKGDCTAYKPHKRGKTIVVTCGTTDHNQVWLFRKLFSPYGHIWEGEPNKKGRIDLACYLNLTFAFLLSLEDEVPEIALKDEENFFAFLGGYTDAEGFIGINNGQATFSLQSYDVNILHQIQEKLSELGIELPKPTISVPRGYVDKRGVRFNWDYWHLATARMDSLMVLLDRIEPYIEHRKRVEGIKACRENIRERKEKRGR
jgi:hypothetical protein